MPAVRILDNVQLDANGYAIKIKEVEAGGGKVWPGQFMVMDPAGKQVTLPGMHLTEPTFGLPATWIDASLRRRRRSGVIPSSTPRRCLPPISPS
jgi:flagellar biosynthesis protein FlhA